MRSRRSISSFVFPLSIVMAGAVFAQNPPASVPRTLDVPDNGLVASGKAAEVDFLFTGDVIGYIEDCGCKLNPAGGVARRAWVVKQLQANYPSTPLVLLDTGNFSDNPTEMGDLRTAALLQSMKTLGYKAINVGERDLTLGYDDFKARTEKLGMTFLSTNIVTQGTKDPVFPPYAVFEVKGTSGKPVRVGVLGVDRYNPIWQKAGPSGTNLGMAAPGDMIAKYLPEVREKSDVVVLLASIAKEDARELAQRFPDLDLVFGAYAGVFSTVEESEGPVRIIFVGNQGKRFGESRVTLDAKRRVSEVTSYVHFLTVRYPADKQMEDSIAAVVAKTKKSAEAADPASQKKAQLAAPAAGGH